MSIVVIGADADQQSSSGLVILKLWKDGFTINDSDIRSYNEPENIEFLAAVKRGEVPAEIRQQVQGADLRLDMEDHRHETYVPTKAKVKAFSGKGHMLGRYTGNLSYSVITEIMTSKFNCCKCFSPSPATVGMTVPADPADQAANEAQAKKELNVDSSQPTTTIQIRLVDGSTVRAQFNLMHTVSDIRRYIITYPLIFYKFFSILLLRLERILLHV